MKTFANQVIENSRTLGTMQKRRNSSIVTIVGEEHIATNNTVHFCLSPDLSIISELKFKIVSTAAFSNVVLDNTITLGWSGGAGINPDAGSDNFYDLLEKISGTGYNLFNGGVHTLTFTGGGTVKAMMYAKYSARNR